MNIPVHFEANKAEKKWYDFWLENKFFHSEPNEKPPYTIVIPPPNVTGILHMGHMLNNTLQDVLIRRARMKGYNACWVPGTDHASIATEAKVVAKLKAEGIDKADLTREEFLKHAWDWTDKYGGTILEQLKKLGCSCDWDRTRFTLEEDLSNQVIHSFIDLYNKGFIYRGYRMVNWDPEAKTNISDEEVVFKEQNGKLYHLKYQIEGSEDFLTVATTRPETIFGDIAVCVNPEDERYQHLVGKKVIVPIVNRSIPIITDEYVDIEFGTGTLKITPAHDVNDYEIGKKNNLQVIDAIDDDGNINHHGLHYAGKDRFVVRKEIAKELDEKGLLVKAEDYVNKVGTSERTGAVIEPKISQQWFLKMSDLAKPALDVVMDNDIKFHPEKFKNTYRHWMENIRDWNISRQLWWGQQIPAYYYGEGENDFVVAENKEQALKLAQDKSNNPSLVINDIKQDEDALDTWFSSWLWPMSVFNGLNGDDQTEIDYYYPTADLVTGPDIIFFWVARMVMAGLEYRKEIPFKNVYFTGIVRDKLRRKMSKSLGNSPDPIELLEKYSADGVRCGLLLSASAGNDILFDEELCNQGKGFSNKIWNAFKLIKGWEIDETIEQPKTAKIAIECFNNQFQKTLAEIEDHFDKYRISDALMATYKLVWDDLCSWLLEMVKPAYQKPIDAKTYQDVIAILENNLRLLHPFMPFITEEIWHLITERTKENALVISEWPKITSFDQEKIHSFDFTKDVIAGIRTVRKDKNISFKDTIELHIINNEKVNTLFDVIIQKLGNVSSIEYVNEQPKGSMSYRVKSNEYFIPMSGNVNLDEEIEKLENELSYLEGFLKSVRKKLSNERFVSGAPDQVIQNERKKEADALSKIETIKNSLDNLK